MFYASSAHYEQIFHNLFSQIVQPSIQRRRLKTKISAAEFNKLLQANGGFDCGRTRQKAMAR